MKIFLLSLGLIICSNLIGQISPILDIPVSINSSTLDLPLIGGINNAQPVRVDLNNDGIKDLYIFDKVGNVSMTFLHDGSMGMNYTYAPTYARQFPDLQRIVLLRDYNADGAADIFALDAESGGAGLQVHRGEFVNDTLTFTRLNLCCEFFNVIYYEANSGKINLLIPSTDYPAIEDMDGDGDLDILTFSQAGLKVDYFENQSVERGYGLDSLQFIRADDCWGRFKEQGVTVKIDLGPDEDTCASSLVGPENQDDQSKSAKHAGSTISLFDMNGDGVKEAFLGDISYNNITKLSNGGVSTAEAWMNDQENDFPTNDTPVNISVFPASYFLDLDNDGLSDFVAASHNIGNTEDFESFWFYKNVGTSNNPVFELQNKSMLVDQTIDFGTGAHPTFVDENGDGLLDIVVGNFSYFIEGGGNDSRLFLFRNTGTQTDPAFDLIDDDWLSFSTLNPGEWNFKPTFGDIDLDGDLDLLVGSETGKIHLARNNSGASNPMSFGPIEENYLLIDVGVSASPHLFDLNDDGQVDLLVGERSGNVNLFTHTGIAATPFGSTPDEAFFGEFDVREMNGFGGHSAPFLVEVDDEYFYFVGSESGGIHLYKDVSLVDNSSTLISRQYEDIKVGWYSSPAFADINNDGKLDLLVGNRRGGLNLFSTILNSESVSVTNLDISDVDISIFPNPASDKIQIVLPVEIESALWQAFAVNGQIIDSGQIMNDAAIDVSNWKPGIYILKLISSEGTYSKKFVVIDN